MVNIENIVNYNQPIRTLFELPPKLPPKLVGKLVYMFYCLYNVGVVEEELKQKGCFFSFLYSIYLVTKAHLGKLNEFEKNLIN